MIHHAYQRPHAHTNTQIQPSASMHLLMVFQGPSSTDFYLVSLPEVWHRNLSLKQILSYLVLKLALRQTPDLQDVSILMKWIMENYSALKEEYLLCLRYQLHILTFVSHSSYVWAELKTWIVHNTISSPASYSRYSVNIESITSPPAADHQIHPGMSLLTVVSPAWTYRKL